MTAPTSAELAEVVRKGIPPRSMREEPHRALDALDALLARAEEAERENVAIRGWHDDWKTSAERAEAAQKRLSEQVDELEESESRAEADAEALRVALSRVRSIAYQAVIIARAALQENSAPSPTTGVTGAEHSAGGKAT